MKFYKPNKFYLYIWLIIYFVSFTYCKSNQSKGEIFKTPQTELEQVASSFRGEEGSASLYKTIYFHEIDNQTSESYFMPRLHYKLRLAFNSDGRLKVENNSDTADLLLDTKVIEYLEIPLRYDSLREPREYQIKLTIELDLMQQKNNKDTQKKEFYVILEKKIIYYYIKYSSNEAPFETKYSATERLLDGLVNRILVTSIKGWYSNLKTEEELGKEKTDSNLLNNSDPLIRKDLPIEIQEAIKKQQENTR